MSDELDMVERVARAISRTIDDERFWNSHGMQLAARAAIAAMAEPTEAMIDAGVSADAGKTWGDRVTNCYRAMIAAAPTPSGE
jgi:hypothetical protein